MEQLCKLQDLLSLSHALTYLWPFFSLPCMCSGNAYISRSFLKDIAPPMADVMANEDDAAPNYRHSILVSTVYLTGVFCPPCQHTLEWVVRKCDLL